MNRKYKIGDWVIVDGTKTQLTPKVHKYIGNCYRIKAIENKEPPYVLDIPEEKAPWRWSEDRLKYSLKERLEMLGKMKCKYKKGDDVLIITFKRGIELRVYDEVDRNTGWAKYCGTWQKIKASSEGVYLLESG